MTDSINISNPSIRVNFSVVHSMQFYLQIEPKLSAWFDKSSNGWSHNARVITKAWLKDGLRPRCITRDLKWGIPVPLDNYRNKVIDLFSFATYALVYILFEHFLIMFLGVLCLV